MNKIIATVTEIQNCDSLHIVKFDFKGQTLSMMSLDIGDDIKPGSKVDLVTKPSQVAIAKNFSGEVSYSNQLDSVIESIENGQLLSSVKLRFFDTVLESIITLSSSQKMDLKSGRQSHSFYKSE